MTGIDNRVIWFENGEVQLRSFAPPRPGRGDVLYRVEAFALNRSELLFMDDTHYVPRRQGVRIGYEACGVVEAVGEGVETFRPGDRVSSIPFASDAYGVNGAWAVTPAEWLAPWPDSLSPAEACSAWMQYLTAYYPLFELAPVGEGQAVLISAASSSAAIGACQMAKLRGARTIGLTRRSDKADALMAAGYDAVIATEEVDNLSDAVGIAAKDQVILVAYDAVCGDLIGRYVGALGRGATIFAYGNLSEDPDVRLPLIAGVRGNISVHAYSTPNFSHDPERRRQAMSVIQAMLDDGRLRPLIDRTFPFERWRDAYAHLRRGAQVGKVVVTRNA